jgi:hypothetical protein
MLVQAAQHHHVAAYVRTASLYDIAADCGHVSLDAPFDDDIAADGDDTLLHRAAHDDRLSKNYNVAAPRALHHNRSSFDLGHGRDYSCLRASLSVRRGSRKKKRKERREGVSEAPRVPAVSRSVQ